ncbi:MAG: ATP-binding protein [Myxococcales bacterium]|nr:ATP-binding protein [Myxococcales bacterium]
MSTTPSAMPSVLVSPDGRYMVVRIPTGVAISSLPPAHTVTIEAPGAGAFAIVHDELWLDAAGTLRRYGLRGRALVGAELPARDGRLIVPEGGSRTALWRDDARAVLLTAPGDVVVAEPFEVRLTTEDVLIALGGRQLAVCRADAIRIVDVRRGEIGQFRLRGDGRLLSGHTAFGGRWLVLHLRNEAGTDRLAVVNRGAVVHEIDIPPTHHVAVAGTRGLALTVGEGGEIAAYDLRTRARIGTRQTPFAVRDIAITPSGTDFIVVDEDAADHPAVWVSFVDAFGVTLAEAATAARLSTDADEDARADDEVVPADLGAVEAAPRPPPAAPPPDAVEAAPPRPRPAPRAPRPRPDQAAEHVAAQRVLEIAMCHAALLFERLFFLCRNVGLLPRTTSADDPLAPIVISDADVNTILSGLERIKQAPSGQRQAPPDPFAPRIEASRAVLAAAFADPSVERCGLVRLIRAFELDDVLTDLFLLALASDWDLRLTRLSGFLNNDASALRVKMGHLAMAAQVGPPSIGTDVLDRIERGLFAPGLLVREATADAPLVGQVVRCPDFIVELSTSLLDEDHAVDAVPWAQLRWAADEKNHLRGILRRELTRTGAGRLVVIEGPPGSGRQASALAAGLEDGREVEVCDLAQRSKQETPRIEQALSRCVYRAHARRGILVVRSDGILRAHARLWDHLWSLVSRFGVRCLVLVRTGELESIPTSVRFVRHGTPHLRPEDRRELWDLALAERGIPIAPAVLDDVAARYAVTPGRLLEVADELNVGRAERGDAPLEVNDIRETLRAITVQRLSNLATRYDSSITLDDLIYPESVVQRLQELVHRVKYRHRVLSGWQFADKAHESYGVSALFLGPPGTGKTAGAAALANALEIDLYIVDFSSVMSKWVGETEQNLAKVFDESEASSVGLLFDEADALFGKRSSNQDSSSDRYANLTVNYLIQRMESFSGLAILTTNLETAMDDAFQRRITARIRFPPSEERQRQSLWKHLLPGGVRYAPDVDLGALASMYKMEGAYIRRALTRAAFRAASSGRAEPILTQRDLLWAALAEYEDMGRVAHLNSGAERTDGGPA